MVSLSPILTLEIPDLLQATICTSRIVVCGVRSPVLWPQSQPCEATVAFSEITGTTHRLKGC
jgi:hypothetical protein